MSRKKYKVSTDVPDLPEILGGTPLSLFDQGNPDINLFNMVDDEIIRLSGSELLYYKFHYSEDEDDVYREKRSKVHSKEPIRVYGHYDPTVLEQSLSEFGIEMTNDQEFTFNGTYIRKLLHRDPMEGDIIKPVFQNQKYEIIEVQEDSFEMYGVYHLRCAAKLLRDSEEVHHDRVTERPDDLGGYINLE
jgi:hypothetical protein